MDWTYMIWFGWSFMAHQLLKVILCQILFIHINWIYMIWFAWVLWHINHCALFNAKSSSPIYIEYIGFGWVGFYGTSTIVGYFAPNLFSYIYIRYTGFGLIAKSYIYIYIYIHTYIYIMYIRCVPDNLFKHQSFVYTQLNDQTVLFQTVQFSTSHLLANILKVKQFHLTHR